METNIENLEHKSPMLERIAELAAKFKSNEEAITFYSKELELLSAKYERSIEAFLIAAEHAAEHNDDFISGLFIAKRLKMLRRIELEA